MGRKKIWVISEFYYPELNSTGYFLTTIAEHLAQKNDVSVITASVNNESSFNKNEIINNVIIHRVRNVNLDKNNKIQRILKLALITFRFAAKILRIVKKGDDVFCVTNPAFIILFIPLLKKIKKDINATILVYDVFPENLHAVNFIKNDSSIFRVLQKLYNWSYNQFDNVITIGRDMQDVFFEKMPKNHKKIKMITNWAENNTVIPEPKGDNVIIKELGIEKPIVIQFAGNIGRAQGFEKLIPIIASCDPKKFHFLFIGGGAYFDELESYLSHNNIEHISLLNSLSRSEQNIFLNACDIGLITLNAKMYGLGVPSKSYNILASGKPILLISDSNSEIALMVKEENVGWVVGNDELSEIPSLLNKISDSKEVMIEMGKRARLLAEGKYSRNSVLDKYTTLYNK